MLSFNNVVVVFPSSIRPRIVAKCVQHAESACARSVEKTEKMRRTGSALFATRRTSIFLSFYESKVTKLVWV